MASRPRSSRPVSAGVGAADARAAVGEACRGRGRGRRRCGSRRRPRCGVAAVAPARAPPQRRRCRAGAAAGGGRCLHRCWCRCGSRCRCGGAAGAGFTAGVAAGAGAGVVAAGAGAAGVAAAGTVARAAAPVVAAASFDSRSRSLTFFDSSATRDSASRLALAFEARSSAALAGASGSARRLAQLQLVRRRRRVLLAILDRGLHAAGCLPARRVGPHHRRTAGKPLAVRGEVGALCRDRLSRLAGRNAHRLVGARHLQGRACPHQVHVVVDEGLRVAAIQRHQHLIQRHPGALRARRNTRQRVASAHRVLVALRPPRRGGGCRRGGGRGAAGRARRRRRCRRRGGCCRGRDRRRRGRHGRGGRRRRGRRRGRQRRRRGCCGVAGAGARAIVGGSTNRVYSRTSRPLAQVSSRITSTKGSCTARSLLRRRYGRPSGAAQQLRRRAGQHRVVVDAGGAIGLRRRDSHLQRAGLFAAETGDIDLGLERLAESRLHTEASQAERQRARRRQPQGGSGHGGQGETARLDQALSKAPPGCAKRPQNARPLLDGGGRNNPQAYTLPITCLSQG